MSRGFQFLATVSAAVCLALAVLTLRSLWYIDHWSLHADRGYRAVHLERGRLEWQQTGPSSGWVPSPGVTTRYAGVDVTQNADVLLQGDYHRRWNSVWSIDCFVAKGTTVSLPLWPPILLTAILPTVMLWRRWRPNHRKRAGCCPHCGYDLRATPDCCPECGHRPAEAAR